MHLTINTALQGAMALGMMTTILVVILYLMRKLSTALDTSRPVVAKNLLTPNEIEFYYRLKRALPNYEIFPQVAMGALLDMTITDTNADYWNIRNSFGHKIVDFVVCAPTSLKIIAVVELDDATHDAKKDKDANRDAALRSVGIATIRWDSRKKPTEAAISQCFKSTFTST